MNFTSIQLSLNKLHRQLVKFSNKRNFNAINKLLLG